VAVKKKEFSNYKNHKQPLYIHYGINANT